MRAQENNCTTRAYILFNNYNYFVLQFCDNSLAEADINQITLS